MPAPTLLKRLAFASDASGDTSSTSPKVGRAVSAAFGRASCGVSNTYMIIGGDSYNPYATTASMLNYDNCYFFTGSNITPARTVMTPGNHDNGNNASGVPDNAAWMAYQTSKGTLTKTDGGWINQSQGIPNTDQFMDIGGIRFFFINSGGILSLSATPGWPVPHTGGAVAGNARVTWLRNNWKAGLANVVVTHHPRWSYYGDHHDNPTMQNLIDEIMGVNDNSGPHSSLILQGHDHNVQIMQPRGASGSYPGLTSIVMGLCSTGPYTAAGPSGQTSQKSWLQFANITSGGVAFLQIDVMSDGSIVCTAIDASDTNGNALTNTSSTGISGAGNVTIQTGTPSGTVSYSYNIDGAGWISNGGNKSIDLTGLAPGPHSMQVETVDSILGTSDISSYTWFTPSTTPNAPVISSAIAVDGSNVAANAQTTSPDLTFTVTTDPGTTLQATLDGVSLGTVVSPYTVSNASIAAHTIVFRANNGGVLSSQTSFSWTRTSTGNGPGSGAYQASVSLPGGVAGSTVPETIMVRGTDLAGAATVTTRHITLSLAGGSFGVSGSIISPVDGSTFTDAAGNVTLDCVADSTVNSVQATIDGTTFYTLTTIGSPIAGLQEWGGVVVVPVDATPYTINVIFTDGVTTDTESVTVTYDSGPVVVPIPSGIPQIIARKVTTYTVVHVDRASGNDVGPFNPESLNGTLVLNDAGSVEYTLNVEHPMARRETCDEDVHDFRVERNGVPFMAGELDTVAVDTSSRTITVTGKTYEAYLAKAYMPYSPSSAAYPPLVYTNIDVLDAIRRLLDYTVAIPNSIPLTFSSLKSGIILPVLAFDPSALTDMLSTVQQLAGQTPGFDFNIDANCHMNFFVPQKGKVSDLQLELDANATSISYTSEGIRGNKVIGSGSLYNGATAYRNAGKAVSQALSRIQYDIVDFGTVPALSTLQSATDTEANLASQKQRDMVVTVDPSGDDYMALATVGDSIHVRANTYYEQIDSVFRCTELSFEMGLTGRELLTYTFTPNTTGVS